MCGGLPIMGMERIGELILTYRQRENISLSALAERTGVSKTALSKIETGETKRPGFALWKKIARTLNIPYAHVVRIYLDATEQPATIKLLLDESIALNNKTLMQKAAQRLLETPKMDTFLALDHLLQVTKGAAESYAKLALHDVMIDFARKQGIPYYLGKSLYERYMLERDDFSRFEETYRRGKELLHYIEFLSPQERIDFYYRMGVHAYILEYYAESIDLCSKGIRSDETDSRSKASALISIVNAYLHVGDLIMADVYLKMYEASKYADYRKDHLRALLHAKKGEYEEAIRLYHLCLEEVETDRRITIVSDLLEVYLDSGNDDRIKELIVSEDQFLPADILAHPYRIKQAARYYKRKGVCQLSIGLVDEGFASLLESMGYYQKLGDSDRVMECVGLYLQHHRLHKRTISFDQMEKIERMCHNDAIKE